MSLSLSLLSLISENLKTSWPWPRLLKGQFVIPILNRHLAIQCTKFEVARFSRSGYIIGGLRIWIGHVTITWPFLVHFFSARYIYIYISRLSYDVSVRLSVMFVHSGHRVRWIPDIFACLDRWMYLLFTDNAWPGWCQDFWWKRGVWKKW